MGWNFGDILDAISPVIPAEAPAFKALGAAEIRGEREFLRHVRLHEFFNLHFDIVGKLVAVRAE